MRESYRYSWKQDVQDGEVEIIFTPAITADDAKQLVVTFAKQEVKVVLHGNILLEGSVFGPIHQNECCWVVSDGLLHVTLFLEYLNSMCKHICWPRLIGPREEWTINSRSKN